ncbi:MAG TPA: hypothetical protein VGN32_01465 [Ktedonobacterales bacterium]|jgi:hypothetical protein|nr:hypothetical protein [Ktedonobacterales bacterium]
MNETQENLPARQRRVGVSRRAFVQGAGVLVAGGWLRSTLPPAHTSAVASEPAPPVHALGQAAFAAYLGQSFRIEDGAAAPLDVRLVDVADRRPLVGGHHGGESFALIFRGPGDRALAQKTYQFSHPDLGTFALFIVPGLVSPDGVNHEAIINRLPAH